MATKPGFRRRCGAWLVLLLTFVPASCDEKKRGTPGAAEPQEAKVGPGAHAAEAGAAVTLVDDWRVPAEELGFKVEAVNVSVPRGHTLHVRYDTVHRDMDTRGHCAAHLNADGFRHMLYAGFYDPAVLDPDRHSELKIVLPPGAPSFGPMNFVRRGDYGVFRRAVPNVEIGKECKVFALTISRESTTGEGSRHRGKSQLSTTITGVNVYIRIAPRTEAEEALCPGTAKAEFGYASEYWSTDDPVGRAQQRSGR